MSSNALDLHPYVSRVTAAAMAFDAEDDTCDIDTIHEFLDDVARDVEPVHQLIADLVLGYAVVQARDSDIVGARLGINGARPETLAHIGSRHGVSRERARQLAARGIKRIARHALSSAHVVCAVLGYRYPPGGDVQRLSRLLIAESCDSPSSAKDLAYLKLRIAGHTDAIASAVALQVADRGLRMRRNVVRRQRSKVRAQARATEHLKRWLQFVEWPTSQVQPSPMPTAPARRVDTMAEGRGSFYLAKVRREVGFDSLFEAALLRKLDESELIETFLEQPVRIRYVLENVAHSYYPDVVIRLCDGRVMLLEVKPVHEVAYFVNQAKFSAARAYAHERGWGWLVWTGRISLTELRRRDVDAESEGELVRVVSEGRADWRTVREVCAKAELDMLDVVSITLRRSWKWERTPFRLSRSAPFR